MQMLYKKTKLYPNSLAGTTTNNTTFSRIIAVIKDLHYLPVEQLLICKTLPSKSIHTGTTGTLRYLGTYLTKALCTYSYRCSITDRKYLKVHKVLVSRLQVKKLLSHSFAHDTLALWSGLPDLQAVLLLSYFWHKIKTHIFSKAYPTYAFHLLVISDVGLLCLCFLIFSVSHCGCNDLESVL